jgi:hypothetical protein
MKVIRSQKRIRIKISTCSVTNDWIVKERLKGEDLRLIEGQLKAPQRRKATRILVRSRVNLASRKRERKIPKRQVGSLPQQKRADLQGIGIKPMRWRRLLRLKLNKSLNLFKVRQSRNQLRSNQRSNKSH